MTDAPASTSVDRPIIRLVDVHRRFGPRKVLRGVTLDIPRERCTVILGASGTGKSVLLKHVVGLLHPNAGEVWVEDTRVDGLRESQLAPIRKRIGYLFQHGALFDSMTVGENVGFPLEEHTDLNSTRRRERIRYVLGLVGLTDIEDQMPANLSGGQQRRVALARAIVLEPDIILYDEPTTGLDPLRADAINDLILKLQRELDATSVVITHDLTSAFKIADRLVMLHDGRIQYEDEREAFRNSDDPVVRHFLLQDVPEGDAA